MMGTDLLETAETRHEFMPDRRPLRRLFRAVWGIIGGLSLLVLAGAFLLASGRITEQGIQRDDLVALALTLAVLYFTLRSLVNAAATFVASADITAAEDGVRLYVLGRRARMVPWEHIAAGRLGRVKSRPTFRPEHEDDEVYLVHVRGLGIAFRLAAAYYRAGFTPAFVVSSDHGDHAALLARIRMAQGAREA